MITWNVLLTLVLPLSLSPPPPSPVVEEGTPVHGNDEVERNLVLVEKVAYHKGLSPEAVSVMLEFAMSLRMGKTRTNSALLLFLMSYIISLK